ncbi:MAG: cytochrome c-type biogenesis protein CcmH [Nitrospirae bacterium]|nr:cytochrome c-type biogenesis protein CcmH [Nitrospirota bacterium]
MKIITLALIFILIASPLSVLALSVNDVAQEFVCNCGCGKMLDACEMKACAGKLKELIQKKIDNGWTRERIVEYFSRMYGEKILSAPTKKGFNLTAWIAPFLAIALGGLAIYLIIIKWVKTRKKLDKKDKFESKGKEEDNKYREKLKKELDKFDW